ncbi:MAG: hypothetical protein ABSE80_14600 [Halobacteriota archaeon]|jgi:hypothetical protein
MKKIFNAIFFQSWGTFTNETLICVAVTKKEILCFMKRNGVKPDLIERFERKADPSSTAAAFTWTPPGFGVTILWMNSWVGDDEDLNTLVHETNHLLYDISRDKGFTNEPEVQAYQQEYLFKNIRKELERRRKKFVIKSNRTKR